MFFRFRVLWVLVWRNLWVCSRQCGGCLLRFCCRVLLQLFGWVRISFLISVCFRLLLKNVWVQSLLCVIFLLMCCMVCYQDVEVLFRVFIFGLKCKGVLIGCCNIFFRILCIVVWLIIICSLWQFLVMFSFWCLLGVMIILWWMLESRCSLFWYSFCLLLSGRFRLQVLNVVVFLMVMVMLVLQLMQLRVVYIDFSMLLWCLNCISFGFVVLSWCGLQIFDIQEWVVVRFRWLVWRLL